MCSICGKSRHDEVEKVVVVEEAKSRFEDLDWLHIGKQAAGGLAVVLALVVLWKVFSGSGPAPDPAALPTPVPTSSTTTLAPTAAPTVGQANRLVPREPGEGVGITPTETVPADQRELDLPTTDGDGTGPWDGLKPVNVATGEPLPEIDFGAAIAVVADDVASVPGTVSLTRAKAMLNNQPLHLDITAAQLSLAEDTQPFAGRAFVSDDISGEVWLFAAADDPDSQIYLATAKLTWSIDDALEQFAPRPGVRIHRVADDDTLATWVSHQNDRLLVVFVPSGTETAAVAAVIEKW